MRAGSLAFILRANSRLEESTVSKPDGGGSGQGHGHGCDFIPQGQTVNAKLYCSVLRESVVAANDLNCAPHNTLKRHKHDFRSQPTLHATFVCNFVCFKFSDLHFLI